MKIVQVQTQAEAAGAQRVSDMVGVHLRSLGHDVRTVFMYRKTGAYDADPYADFVLKSRPRGLGDRLLAILGLLAYMQRARPDAVISYQHYGNIFGTLAGRLAGTRRLLANQSGAPGRFGGRFAALADRLMGRFGSYDFSVVNSGWMERQFASFPRAYRNRLRRIDHGVDVPADLPDRHAARTALGLPEDVFLAVSTGRLTADKNQAALIRALVEVSDMHLALAGDGPERAALVDLAAGLGVKGRLRLVGELRPEQVFSFLAAGDVFLFASRTETFGLSAVEAAVSGIPVVANGLPVLREVLGDAALYVDTEAPGTVANAVRRLRREPELAARLSAYGRDLRRRYSPSRMGDAYAALITR